VIGIRDGGAILRSIDHARQHESAGRRHDFRTLALRRLRDRAPLTDPRDFAAVHDDRGVRHGPRAVEEAVDLEDSPHRAGSIVRECPTR